MLLDRDEGEEAGSAGSEFDNGVGDVFFLSLGFGVSLLVEPGKRAGKDELAPSLGEVGERSINSRIIVFLIVVVGMVGLVMRRGVGGGREDG